MIDSKQIAETYNKVIDWNKKRNIPKAYNPPKECGNILDEVLEGLRATDEHKLIDSYCDVIVFAMGAAWKRSVKKFIIVDLPEYQKGRNYIVEKLVFMLKHDLDHTNMLTEMIQNAIMEIEYLGYDWFIAMDETMKEINDRTGSWNSKVNKWIKGEPKEDAYKANYSKAKKF